MYFIVVKFPVKAEYASRFPEITAEFTAATRQELGNLWFEWSRSLADPNEYVLIEAFDGDEAASAHVSSAHFAAGLDAMRPALSATPKILSRKVDGSDWDEMGELKI